MNIALDLMGGDFCPAAAIDGAREALALLPADTGFTLYGNAEALALARPLLAENEGRVSFVACAETIGCDEQPTLAIRKKKDSSMVRALSDVAAGSAHCLVSAGSTGALLTGGTLIVRRLRGVKRPALATTLPTKTGCVLLIDCGANTDCKPRYLQQFAIMGAAYMEKVLGVKVPRVGLLSNGSEAEKGNELTKAAHALLTESPVRFAGNCEARNILSGNFDVVVCDGFDGNVALKSIEGTASLLMGFLKAELLASARGKLGAALAKPAFAAVKRKLDYAEYGGAPLLGVSGGVVKAHGSSNGRAFAMALVQAQKLIAGNVIGLIGETVAALPETED